MSSHLDKYESTWHVSFPAALCMSSQLDKYESIWHGSFPAALCMSSQLDKYESTLARVFSSSIVHEWFRFSSYFMPGCLNQADCIQGSMQYSIYVKDLEISGQLYRMIKFELLESG